MTAPNRIRPLTPAERQLAILLGLFPRSFGSGKPLKRGIREDLLASFSSLNPDELAGALALHTTTRQYYEAAAEQGAMRVDHDGVPVGPVSESDRQYALRRLQQLDHEELVEQVDNQAREISELRDIVRRLEGEVAHLLD